MNSSKIITRGAFASMTVLAALLISASAAAVTVPAPSRGTTCPLERIDAQYVRCDDLTGLGASAPAWIPEQ